jgi:hypothetical protein
MKITVHTNPPAGYTPQPVIKIFSPIEDTNVCVICQLYSENGLLVNPQSAWVAIETQRVEKIKFVTNPTPKTHEQIQDVNSRRPGRD